MGVRRSMFKDILEILSIVNKKLDAIDTQLTIHLTEHVSYKQFRAQLFTIVGIMIAGGGLILAFWR